MPNTYSIAHAVASVAERMIESYHPRLRGVRIEYLWRTEPVKRRNLTDLGTVAKITGRNAFLAKEANPEFALVAVEPGSAFFSVEVWMLGWAQLEAPGREKLVDHLLSMLDAKEVADEDSGIVSMQLSIKAPPVVQFPDVEERHPDVEDISEAIEEALTISAESKAAARQQERDAKKAKKKRKGAQPPSETVPDQVQTRTEKVGDETLLMTVRVSGGETRIDIESVFQHSENATLVSAKRVDSIDEAEAYFDEFCTARAPSLEVVEGNASSNGKRTNAKAARA